MVRMVVRQAVLLAMSGTAVGLAAAAGLTSWMESLLFGVSRTEPSVYGGAAVLLVAVAAVAAERKT
jgi:hypothetical protein